MPRKLKNIELNRLSVDEFRKAQKLPIVAVLDNVRSMLNVGSVFRTSDAFRLDRMYLCGITAKPPHRDITKTAIGAEQSVDWVHVPSTLDAVQELKQDGFVIYGVEQTDTSVSLDKFDFSSPEKRCFIFGNEVDGVDEEVVQLCDHLIEIPQMGTKHSLNISVCAGVVLWEASKAHVHEV
jgi:tRNA G18 (ribose-2'-O)-methylase SpoU